MQAFNLAGASPFSNVTLQATNPLPPVTTAEVSEDQIIKKLEEETQDDKNDYVIKYLILGSALAVCLIVLMLVCTIFNYCQRKKTAATIKSCTMTGRFICGIFNFRFHLKSHYFRFFCEMAWLTKIEYITI